MGSHVREMDGRRRGLLPSMAKPKACYLLEGRVLITTTWASLHGGFIKTTPFSIKPCSPRSLPAAQRPLFSLSVYCRPLPCPPASPFSSPCHPLVSKPEFQPRHELQSKNNFSPPARFSSNCMWGRHLGVPFLNTHLDLWRLYLGRKSICQEVA